MANPQIKFYKVESLPTSLEVGALYFDKTNGVIHVATGTTSTDKFGGQLTDATLQNGILTISKADGSSVTCDFNDIASATSVATALSGINTRLNGIDTSISGLDTSVAALQAYTGYVAPGEGEAAPVLSYAKGLKVAKNALGSEWDTKDFEGPTYIELMASVPNVLQVGIAIGSNNRIMIAPGETLMTTISAVNTLVGEDTGKSVRAIAAEELAAQLIPETALESLDTLKEIADWIQAHPASVTEMNTNISNLQQAVAGINGKTVILTDYNKTGITGDIVATDSVNNAIAKLENRLDAAVAGSVTSVNGKAGAVTIATGSANGTIAVGGGDVAVKGLGSAAYTELGAYATAAQGGKADTAIQSVAQDDATYTVVSTTGTNVTVKNKIQSVGASSTSAKGLAEASDVKSYVDAQVSGKNVDAAGDTYVSATAANNKVTVSATQSTKDSLALADTAYQKPATGIPYADLNSTVQQSLDYANNAFRGIEVVDDDIYAYLDTNMDRELSVHVHIGSVADGVTGLANSKDVKTYVDSVWEWAEFN